MSSALSTELGANCRAYIEEDGGFGAHGAILRPAERQGVDPGAPGSVGGVAAEPSDGVGEAGAIQVNPHAMVVGEVGE